MAICANSTTAPARPLLPLDRRAIGCDGWARARELAARLGGEIRDHLAEGMRQAWAAARSLLQAAASASASSDASALASDSVAATSAFDRSAQGRSVDQIGNSDVVDHTDHIGAVSLLFPAPAPLPSLTVALSRRRAIFGAVAVDEPDTAAEARAIHARRELHQALDFGFALLDAIDLGPAALDLMDGAIAALDALDGDADLEDEPAEDDGTLEPCLASPERSPEPPPVGYCGRWGAYVDRSSNAAQTNWAQGARHDCELDPCDGPIDEDELDDDGIWRAEGDDSDHEPWLASPAGDGDQEHWAQGDSRDHEDVNENGGGEYDPGWYARPIGPVRPDAPFYDHRQAMRAVARQAEAVRERIRGPRPRRDPDLVTFVGMPAGTVMWGGPVPRTFLRDGVPVAVMTAI